MKPDLAALQRAAPEVSARLIAEHLKRLDDEYFNRFDVGAIADHLRGLAQLSPLLPVELLVGEDRRGLTECTVVGLDAPGMFSLITGILMSMGFSINSGEVYTYAPSSTPATVLGGSRQLNDVYRRRRIVDVFAGQRTTPGEAEEWAGELRQRLVSTIGLLERHAPDGLQLARQRVNEWVTERLEQLGPARPRSAFTTQVEFDDQAGAGLRLRVESEDTPAFLYSLSTALMLHDISIRRVNIRTFEGRVHDELEVDLPQNVDRAVLEKQLRTAVLLTKQFTYFLDRAPDPYAALTRFDWLATQVANQASQADWLALLASSRTMPDLARLLGASDFLWESFIRQHYEEMLATLRRRIEPGTEPPRPRLAQLLEHKPAAEQRDAIAGYRDAQAFLIQLDSILDESGDPAELSHRLTSLAEEIVDASVSLLYQELNRELGNPGAPFAVFALGKFGAGALGFASDLELLLVHGAAEQSEFFAQLLDRLQGLFRGRQEGLFELDLRLRPWGKNAALDCPLDVFRHYYSAEGPAHSLERIALTRLRAIGGDRDFGHRVEQLRDSLVYERSWLVLDELSETRSRQFQQKQAGTRNAKYSSGALVDVEYAVQILQVQHGREIESLRTPNLQVAISELGKHGILQPVEAERLESSYVYLRRLINALRMLHGIAEDLELPQPDSSASRYLARRMGYHEPNWRHASEDMEQDFAATTAFVRSIVRRYVGEAMLPSGGRAESVRRRS